MGTYKVLQDVEADDKLVGSLSLRQFIYAFIAAGLGWASFMAVISNMAYLVVLTAPFMLFAGFLAFPWGKDQPTELWALAKFRFYLKPRKRIWDQSGAKKLVTITVPKRVERHLTDGLSQVEVRSRLNALASTIDSRGWAVKNVNVNVLSAAPSYNASDRLVDVSSLPQEVSSVNILASDDMLDVSSNPVAQQFDAMIQHAAAEQRERLVSQMNSPSPAQVPVANPSPTATPATPSNDYWFLNQPAAPLADPTQATFASSTVVAPVPINDVQDMFGSTSAAPAAVPTAAVPTAEEEALIASHKPADTGPDTVNSHLKTIKTPQQLADEALQARAEAAQKAAEESALQNQQDQMTASRRADIMNLAGNDDLNIATLARQAAKQTENDNGEVVISLR